MFSYCHRHHSSHDYRKLCQSSSVKRSSTQQGVKTLKPSLLHLYLCLVYCTVGFNSSVICERLGYLTYTQIHLCLQDCT